ncbi:hypothetical protein [Bacillus sp. SRB_8]|uniref:hypothetical protein n=1 Tax=unclassified Bacillus (in: firmicutes) TaxID=185979 RepID=UPI000DC5E84A|nr:hypothetical protein [Bacillus sp. SRB_8]RAN68747.1 hypothetical protein B5P40_19825 [Bacillus sp. SRB_8]
MIETIIVKWYYGHCDAHNRLEVHPNGGCMDKDFHALCRKCKEASSMVLSAALIEKQKRDKLL